MPTIYSVQAPDGSILDIEGPDNATDEQISAFAAEHFKPEPVKLAPKDFNAEILKRVREPGATAESVRAFADTVRDPGDPTGTVKYALGPDLEAAIGSVQGGYKGPVQVLDGNEGNATAAFGRGALDAGTFNSGDEITAALQATFGEGTYDQYVQQERAQRAIDANVNPNERMAGEAAGMIASSALPLGKILEAPTLFGRIARGAGVGAGFSALSGYGASQNNAEAIDRLPGDLLVGGTLGAALPLAGAGVQYAANNLTRQGRATSMLENAGVDPIALRAAAQDLSATRSAGAVPPATADEIRETVKLLGKKGSSGLSLAQLADITQARKEQIAKGINVAEVVGPGGDRLRASLAVAPESRYRAAQGAEQAGRDLQSDLKGMTAGRTAATQDLVDNAKRRGDIEFARFRDTPAPLPMGDNIVLGKELGENPEVLRGIPRPEREAILARLETNSLTGGDLDRLRRSARDIAVSQNSPTYKSMAEVIETYLTDAIPQSARAVKNYARRLTRAEGTKIGQTATTATARDFAAARNRPELTNPSGISAADQAILDTLPAKDRGALARKGGVRIGAENAIDTAAGNAKASYTLASNLENGGDAAANLRLSMGDDRANQIIAYATEQKKAIDNLAALAGVPAEQVPTVLDSASAMIQLGTLSFKQGGAGFLSNIATGIAKSLGVGEATAKKLADNLFDPAQFEKTVRLLEARKLPKSRLTNITRNAFFKLAAEVGKDNTETPEGAVIVTPEPPQ